MLEEPAPTAQLVSRAIFLSIWGMSIRPYISLILAPARWLRFAPPPVTGLCAVSFGSFRRVEGPTWTMYLLNHSVGSKHASTLLHSPKGCRSHPWRGVNPQISAPD